MANLDEYWFSDPQEGKVTQLWNTKCIQNGLDIEFHCETISSQHVLKSDADIIGVHNGAFYVQTSEWPQDSATYFGDTVVGRHMTRMEVRAMIHSNEFKKVYLPWM